MDNIEKDGHTIYPITVAASFGLITYNFYLVKHDNHLSLIDAGMDDDSCWAALQDTLKKNGYQLSDITEILLTHHHIDHVGLVNRIIKEHEIPVYAHPNAIGRLRRDPDLLEMRIDFFDKLYKEMNCGVAGEKQVRYLKKSFANNKDRAINTDIKPVKEGDILFNFTVKEVFGHAPDQIAFYDKRRKWLFGGDFLLKHISSNAIVEPDELGNRMLSLVTSINSLKKCQAYEIDYVFPGHGEIIDNLNELISARLTRIDDKALRVLHEIQSGRTTGWEIAEALYQKLLKSQFSLVMSEIIGQLDLLESRQQVKKKWKDGIIVYTAND